MTSRSSEISGRGEQRREDPAEDGDDGVVVVDDVVRVDRGVDDDDVVDRLLDENSVQNFGGKERSNSESEKRSLQFSF